MAIHREALEAAFGSRDLGRLVRLLDERVVWRGLADEEHVHDYAAADGDAPDV
jgi:hypothetical protein